MAFNGSEGSKISVREGGDMTANYRTANPGERKGHFFGRDLLMEILEQEGCMGIRMYYGIDDDGEKQLVICGADASEDDMLDIVGDVSCPCPPCGSANALNS